jgi:hypothetical protein
VSELFAVVVVVAAAAVIIAALVHLKNSGKTYSSS